jgi:hypothetical protein
MEEVDHAVIHSGRETVNIFVCFIPHFSVLGIRKNNIFVVNINRYYCAGDHVLFDMREEGKTVLLFS